MFSKKSVNLLLPRWKIRRELKRLAVQAQSIPAAIYEPFLQKNYDKNFLKNVTLHRGDLKNRKRIAIFLIFQIRSVEKSILITLAHLTDSGYSPVIVSNTSLSNVDKLRLAKHSILIIERPNFGYDFGGYRDAIKIISENNFLYDELLFVNDSVWFPLIKDSDMLEQMHITSASYVGTHVLGNIHLSKKKRGFFPSYCFLIKSPLCKSKAFINYWSEYRLSSNKELTKRRGERHLSHVMLDNSGASTALLTKERYNKIVNDLSREELEYAVQDFVPEKKRDEEKKRSLLTKKFSPHWEEDAKFMLIHGTNSWTYTWASPVLSLTKLKFPMIKKKKDRLFEASRSNIVKAYEEGRLPNLDLTIFSEISKAVEKKI